MRETVKCVAFGRRRRRVFAWQYDEPTGGAAGAFRNAPAIASVSGVEGERRAFSRRRLVHQRVP